MIVNCALKLSNKVSSNQIVRMVSETILLFFLTNHNIKLINQQSLVSDNTATSYLIGRLFSIRPS